MFRHCLEAGSLKHIKMIGAILAEKEAYLFYVTKHKIRITNGGPQLCYLTSDPDWEFFFDHFPSFVYVASSIVSSAQLV